MLTLTVINFFVYLTNSDNKMNVIFDYIYF